MKKEHARFCQICTEITLGDPTGRDDSPRSAVLQRTNMSGGVWFVVCIPTESHEKKIKFPPEQNEKEENNRPNGQLHVDIHNQENTNRNNNVNNAPKIVPSTPKSERKEKKDIDDDEKSLEWHLKDCLEKLAIYDAVWILSKEETFYQVFFPCEGPGMECDFVLQTIQNRGVGEKGLSTIGIMPCDVFYRDYGEDEDEQDEDSDVENDEQSPEKKGKGFKAMQKEFMKSVTARLTVAQVVERVRNDGSLSFDFIMFVFIASCIAALGLSENSAIIIVAAMLISPIMGPIMAFTFGLTIRDKKLMKMALRTELIGLCTCLTAGFLFGFICGNFSETWGAGKWPTPEMAGRGMLRSLWSGCLIALPSGAGVAMSILQGNGASLVGVAISASLLPPTVNCGLLWGLGAIKTVRSLYQRTYVVYDIFNHTVKPALLPPDTYTPSYYPLMDRECAVLGIISFMLTVVNIICIVISALIILKIKEVAPNTTDQAVSRFWKHDVKIARDYNKTLGENEGEDLGKQFLQEWANLNGIDPNTLNNASEESKLVQLQTLMDIVEEAEEDSVFQSISMNVPAPAVEKVSRRLSIAPGIGLGDPGPMRRASIVQGGMKANQLKKRRQSRLPNLMDAVTEDEESTGPTRSAVYNTPLQTADNPNSLWPHKNKGQESSRFNVSPVSGDSMAQLSNIRNNRTRRRSCFPGHQPGAGQRPSLDRTSKRPSIPESPDAKNETTAM